MKPDINDIDWWSLLRYENGKLYWRKRRSTNTSAGSEAGSLSGNGYRKIALGCDGVDHRYYSHQIILAMHGHVIGGCDIDHINGIRDDNRIDNLRLVSHTANQFNARKRGRSSSRYLGVSFEAQNSRWRMQLSHKGKKVAHSRHSDELSAAKAYDRAKSKFLLVSGEDPFEFWRGFNFPEALAIAPSPAARSGRGRKAGASR